MVCGVLALVVALVGCSSPSGGGGGGGGGPLPVSYNITAAAPYLLPPNTPPAGANGSCKPTAAHPRPVILVHGTIATMGENWAVLSPLLKNNGYCVFAFNYGGTWLSSLTFGNVQGLDGSISAANQLKGFVDHVLWATGATKVDIVGHLETRMELCHRKRSQEGRPRGGTAIVRRLRRCGWFASSAPNWGPITGR